MSKRRRAKIVSNRLGVLFILVLLAFIGLSIRLFYIVRTNNNDYQRKILSQQAYNSTTLVAKRGEIVDTNGTVLAASREQYNVILDVVALLTWEEKNNNNGLCQTTTINTLDIVFGVDKEAIYQYIREVPGSRYYVVKKGVSYEDVSRFNAYTTEPEDGKEENSMYNENVRGVWFEKYYVRNYPQGTLASDVLGFSRIGTDAIYGLEEYYDDLLTGTNGRQYGYLSDDTTFEYTTIPAVDGSTLVTTIDANVQLMVEKQLKAYMLEYENNYRDGLGANNIGCIVMKADSGEILAMASYPTFDPNNPMDLSGLYTDEEVTTMAQEGTLQNTLDGLWKNFCISDTYEPGSVMKPFTVAMGLETGKLTGNETFNCTGYLHVGDYDIYCHNRNGDGYLDVTGAVAKSCNVALMQMVSTIGKKTFLDYQGIFNFGLKTNIDLAGESRTDSVVFTDATLGETELATASFGQGLNVTMVQMAAGYAALVNGGYYYEPHIVSKILSSSGAVVKNIEPRLIKQVISQSTSEQIVEYCNAVVTMDGGTGWRAKPAGYSIGGKTGTAETLPRGNGEYVVSFISHAPADNPEIICYVVIDRPNVSVQEDAKYATMVSKEILTDILPYLGIPMTEELTDVQKEELGERDLSILTNREDDSQDDKENNE